ncbi:MAG: anaerobic glycerol-3-phosphate dehydrogenase subunit C [Thermoleophilia bacterium]
MTEHLRELMRDSLDHCVKCTICETYCPVAAATPLFPGPKYAGPQAERYRGGPTVDASLDYCSSCGICTQVCPQGVKIAEINSQAKAELARARGFSLRDRLIARPTLAGWLGAPVAPIANRTTSMPLVRRLMERVLRIHRRAPMPKWAGRTYQSRSRGLRAAPGAIGPAGTVVFFHGCAANFYEPDTAGRAVDVLEHNGLRVIVPRQGCCGLPLQSNGMYDAARSYVRRLAAQLAPYARAGHDIVSTSTSCGLMLKREAREILGVEDDDLRVVSERMYDICEYLALMHERGELRTDMHPVDMEVPYHAPCQQRGHGVGTPAMELMGLVPELRPRQVDAVCCGVAGTYGLKAEKYDIAMEVGRSLFAQVRASGAPMSVCDSETCRWQISAATDLPSVHPVEILHRAYRL